jgi:predicted DCC family thiol-disulfide oxidoreductase YuxK
MNLIRLPKLQIILLSAIFFMFACFFNVSFAQESANKNETNSLREKHKVEKYYWVIYDNVCPYCRSATKHIKDLDWEGKFKFLSYRNPLTYKIFPDLTKEECEKDVHMVTPKGEVLSGYEVFREIIDNLTATKIFNPLLKNNYAEKKLTEIYEKMVKERSCYYKKSDTCKLKSP